MQTPLKVGVVGTGAIGSALCKALDSGELGPQLAAICEIDEAKAHALLASLSHPAPLMDLATLCSTVDIVVEAAGARIAPGVATTALEAGKDVLIMSVGAMLGHPELAELAATNGCHIYLPTGAIAGLDAIRAAAIAGLSRVTLTTTKPPKGLAGAPYVVQHGFDLTNLTEPTTVFEGSAAEAVRAFPANVNVAAALSLAGVGPDQTTVRVVADPASTRNCHRIEAEGAFGHLSIEVQNVPSPTNPKTSYLAALSAMALLKRLSSSQVVGS